VSGSRGAEALERLDDYVSGLLPDDEARSFEEELFAAAAAGDEAAEEVRFFDRFLREARWLASTIGLFSGGATRAEVERLRSSGHRVHFADLGSGGEVTIAGWPADTELVITRLGVDLRGWRDISVEITIGDGPVAKTFRDCTYAPEDGALYAVCHEPLARAAFGHPLVVAEVIGLRDAERQVVARFEVRPA
jgi:hypothetical protein